MLQPRGKIEKNYFLKNGKILQKNLEILENNFLKNGKICAEKKIFKNKISGENFSEKIAEKIWKKSRNFLQKIFTKKYFKKIEQKFCAEIC